jgi:hypothetical protein
LVSATKASATDSWSPGCVGDVSSLVDQRRILPPKFEQHRRQILRRRLHDDLADLGAAGEEDEVEGQFQKLAVSRLGQPMDIAAAVCFRRRSNPRLVPKGFT